MPASMFSSLWSRVVGHIPRAVSPAPRSTPRAGTEAGGTSRSTPYAGRSASDTRAGLASGPAAHRAAPQPPSLPDKMAFYLAVPAWHAAPSATPAGASLVSPASLPARPGGLPPRPRAGQPPACSAGFQPARPGGSSPRPPLPAQATRRQEASAPNGHVGRDVCAPGKISIQTPAWSAGHLDEPARRPAVQEAAPVVVAPLERLPWREWELEVLVAAVPPEIRSDLLDNLRQTLEHRAASIHPPDPRRQDALDQIERERFGLLGERLWDHSEEELLGLVDTELREIAWTLETERWRLPRNWQLAMHSARLGQLLRELRCRPEIDLIEALRDLIIWLWV